MEEKVLELLKNKELKELKTLLNDTNESDIAELLSDVNEKYMMSIFRLINKEKAVEVFALLDVTAATSLIEYLSDAETVRLIDEIPADDATDILEEMPANVVDRILKKCSKDTRKDINRLLNYKEDSAGSIMTVEYPELKDYFKISEAVDVLKKERDEYETISTCFVVDASRRLKGSFEIKELLFNANSKLLSDIMNTDINYVNTYTDQEEVAAMFKKYDLTIMPVVDSETRLVGIITIDDIMDVVEEEATEDIKKMAAIIPIDKPYDKTTVFETFLARIPWLLLLMISATFTGGIIKSFEDQLSSYTILTAFIPMLMDTGGNAGGQASVSIIRALSLNDIEFKDIFKVFFKEFRIAILCSIVLAICNFAKMLLLDGVAIPVAFVVCITLTITIVIAKSIGCILPMLAKRIGFDPAVMASPFITTIVDACSLLVYFKVASMILSL